MNLAILKPKVNTRKRKAFMTIQEQIKHADRMRIRNTLIGTVLVCLVLFGFGGLRANPVEFQGVLDSAGSEIVLVGKSRYAIAMIEPTYAKWNRDYLYAMANKDIVSVPSGTACTVFGEPIRAWQSFKEAMVGENSLMVYKVKVLGQIRYVSVDDVERVND